MPAIVAFQRAATGAATPLQTSTACGLRHHRWLFFQSLLMTEKRIRGACCVAVPRMALPIQRLS
jgi:hypothetical protein